MPPRSSFHSVAKYCSSSSPFQLSFDDKVYTIHASSRRCVGSQLSIKNYDMKRFKLLQATPQERQFY